MPSDEALKLTHAEKCALYSSRKDYAKALAEYLTWKTGNEAEVWTGRLKSTEQRALFGRYIGKGLIIIDPDSRTVRNRVWLDFGRRWEDATIFGWEEL